MEALILVLAAFRLTRLVIKDSIFDSLREKIWNRYPPVDDQMRPNLNIGYLITCPYCIGFWISLILYICYTIDLTYTVTMYAASVLALSAVVGWLARIDDRF